MPDAASHAFPLHPVVSADAAHSRRGEASLVALRNGTVLLTYGRFTGRGDTGYALLSDARVQRYRGSLIERDNDFGEVAAVTLDRNGRVIAPERIIVSAPPDGLNSMNPALRRLPDGRLGLLYSHRLSRHVSSRRFLFSTDEGVTWSQPVVVCSEGYVSGAHDRFNVLVSGRLLAPLHCSEDWEKHYPHTLLACISTDQGKSWPSRRRKILVHDPARNTDYPAVFHQGDEVWIIVRQSDQPRVIQGHMSTALMRVPLRWLRE